MKGNRKYIIPAILMVVLIGSYAVYNYMYKEHRDIASEKIDFELGPAELNEAMSDAKNAIAYTDKVIKTKGKITSVERNSVVLDDKVQVNFVIDEAFTLSLENEILVKGRCVGYDDLLELVKLDQATLVIDN